MCSRKRLRSIDLDDDRKRHSAIGLLGAGFLSAESAALLAPRMVLNMYEQRFGLHRKPFQTVTNKQDFFASSSFNDLLPSVVHALQTDLGVAVLTGPAGVGKSVSLEQIQRTLESTAQTFLLRGGSVKGSADLLYLLHRRLLKLQPDGAATQESVGTDIVRRYEVVERLERVASFWGPLTILLDDAQLLNQDVFSELRSLLEEGHDGRRFARLLIAGPLQLEEVLADSSNSHFARKIRTHAFLQPLRSDESIQYLDHHFQLAGGELTAGFASDALELIVAAADGVPQCLNLLADESLMVCEEADCNKVTRDAVTEALTRLQHLPYSWNVSMVAETVDEDFGDEESGSDAGASAGGNSIEIGEFPSDTFSDSDSRSVTSGATDGVFEIGAPPPVVETVVAEETVLSEEAELVDEPVHAIPPIELDADVTLDSLEQMESLSSTRKLDDADLEGRYVEIESTLPGSSLKDAVEISEDEFAALENELPVTTFEALPSQLLMSDPADDISELAEFVDGEDEDGIVDVAVSETSDVSESINSYEPWAPAGEWPATPLAGGESSQSVSTERIDSESCSASVAGSEFSEPVWDVVPTPVVDRFTWAELGRTLEEDDVEVAAGLQRLSENNTTLQFAAAWPPVTAGVAPVSQIPVSELDDDYAELLNDLGLLIDATAERGIDQELVSSEPQLLTPGNVSAPSTSVELLASAKGPEGTIDELQQLIQKEQQLDQIIGGTDEFPQMHSGDDSDTATQDLTNLDVQANDSSEESHAPTASPRFFSMSQTEVDEDSDSVEHGPQTSGGAMDVSSAAEVNHPDGHHPNEHDPDVVAFQQIVEERDEWLEQETLLAQIVSDEQVEKDQAIPTVLRQARRQRHQSVLTFGLRQAAGAETVPEVAATEVESSSLESGDHAETSDQDRPISLLMPEAKGLTSEGENRSQSAFTETTGEGAKETGFSNLFTRLRRRRGKAS